jgi:hypothetical protein
MTVQFNYDKEMMQLRVEGSVEDLYDAKESYERYFTACRECEQGINTKESVRYRAILEALKQAGETVTSWFDEN